MSWLNWFNNKSTISKTGAPRRGIAPAKHVHSLPTGRVMVPPEPARLLVDPPHRTEERKAMRHVRREQLYSAIRRAMTRAGVLSASFKFKVLSLDQRGDMFIVMMEVHPSLGFHEKKLAEAEALIIETAKTQFSIVVTAVYWRVDAKVPSSSLNQSMNQTASQSKPIAAENLPAVASSPTAFATTVKMAATTRFEPIAEDEVTAFKHALAASAAQAPTATENAGKSRSGLRSYTLLTGFEDTEMPESPAVPALSTTQYGDLN